MKTLVLYATVEGQTRKIAETIAARLKEAGHGVELREANRNTADPAGFDAAILCAPVHIGSYPSPFVHFAVRWKDALNAMPSAFVSVTLAIVSDDAQEQAEAEEFPRQLAKRTGWTPGFVYNCGGALRYTQYDFFKRWMMKRIAAKEHRPTDTSQDYEYTDWTALSAFVDQFAAKVQSSAGQAGG